ncbi:TolC family protein [bacterium]|nr:TolC family protein [bacterium]
MELTKRTFPIRFVRLTLLATLLMGFVSQRVDAQQGGFDQLRPSDRELASYIAEARGANPDLQAWHARVEAAGLKISQAGSWMDPSVSLALANAPTNSFDLNQEPMTGVWLNVSQAIPLTRHYGANKQIAAWQQERQTDLLAERAETIADQIAQTWYDWAYLKAALATVDSTVELVDGLIDVALVRYETGSGLQQDVLRLQTERTRFDDRRAQLEQQILSTRRSFSVLLGRTARDTLAATPTLPGSFIPLQADSLQALLARKNPTLLSMHKETRIAGERVHQAKRALWPDLKLNAGYGFRQQTDAGVDRPDFLTVGVGVSLPIFAGSKQKPAIQEAEAQNREIAFSLQDTEQKLQLALASLMDQDDRLARQIELYEHGILPQADATVQAVTAAWSTGKVDVDALLNSEIVLMNTRLEALARKRDRAKVRSAMDTLFADKESSGPAEEMIKTVEER